MKSIKFDNFEITAREIIASIVIIFIMLLIGVTISNKMQESRLDRNEIYNKAVKIETSELFQYGMRTNVGSAFVSGTLEAVDPVSYPEIEGEYLYLEKVKERYTMHTRQVAHTRTVNGKPLPITRPKHIGPGIVLALKTFIPSKYSLTRSCLLTEK